MPDKQFGGRFDLHDDPPVRYLASSGTHAVAEVLQGLRGERLESEAVRLRVQALALVEVRVTLPTRLVDLDDPATLVALGVRPSEVAHPDRAITQGIARRIHDTGAPGFAWWSRFRGDWVSRVFFLDRVRPRQFTWGTPGRLSITHPEVLLAAEELGLPR